MVPSGISLHNLHGSVGDPVEGENSGLDWYMNKSFKSRTVKVLSSVSGGYCKMRFMDDLLEGHDGLSYHARSTQLQTESSACKSTSDVLDAAYNSDTEQDEGDKIGNMTLKEMRQLVKKSVKKSLEKVRFMDPCPPWQNAPAGGGMLMSDRFLQSSGLELHLDSSTSNSGESSDDVSPRGIATSSHKPIDSMMHNESPSGVATSSHKQSDGTVPESDLVDQLVDCPGQPSKKRKYEMDLIACKSEVSVEDDDCTLEMWQVHKRRSYVGKMPRSSELEQALCMDEQTSCESSMAHDTSPLLSSAILVPSIDNTLRDDLASSSNVVKALGVFEQGSSALSCSFDRPEELRKNSLEPSGGLITSNNVADRGDFKTDKPYPGVFEQGSSALSCSFDRSEELRKNSLKPLGGLITSNNVVDRGDFKTDKPYPVVPINITAGISREDVKNDELTQKHGPLLCEASPPCSSVEPVRGVEVRRLPSSTEAGSWLLKPCSESLSAEVSRSLYGKSESNGHEPTYPREILRSIGHDSSLTMLGQSALVEEVHSGVKKADSSVSSMKPFVLPMGMRNELVVVKNKAVELSREGSDGIYPADLFRYSPPLSAKLKTGLNIAYRSSDSAGVTSQLPLDEDTSGSPISLFSTERLDTEEERELETIKPSKIPSKRKAISPLSRERLLQATKYGDREQNFADRGLKKLPRAFKGFIGRETFNQERMAAFSRIKSSSALESSPPEKPYLKEEVLPGSPCHNREKLLPSKHSAPKISPVSSSCRSSCAAVSTMQSSPSCVQRLSLVLNSSPSPLSQNILRTVDDKSPPATSTPPVPAKGILRSSSPTCQGACKCEECLSLRSRAEKAAEFSQRQMHDIEGLAVKLLKELNTMRCVVEESLAHRHAPRADSPRSTSLNLEQVKKAANNAFETEKMAKSWLVRMARDCNRYCKIMRMQERKLSFADESGGQLCHVKLFHAQAQGQAQPDTALSTDKPTVLTPVETGTAGLTEEPALEVASK